MQTVYTTLSRPGKRPYNEDSISPDAHAGAPDLFLVCDGVGGAAGGEIASRLTAETITAYFNKAARQLDKNHIQEAVKEAGKTLQRHVHDNPGHRGLSTTLALLWLQGNMALIAHAGDSRVYHIRNNQVLFQTCDHSYVNDLVSAGLITREEATRHSKRNIINRVISAGREPANPEVHELSQVLAGDYFFLCTDGILEGIDEKFITERLAVKEAAPAHLTEIMEQIDARCAEYASDNYSAIIVKVEK